MRKFKKVLLLSASALTMTLFSCGQATTSSASSVASSSSEVSSSEVSSSVVSSSSEKVLTRQIRRVPLYMSLDTSVNPAAYMEVNHFNGSNVGYINFKDLFNELLGGDPNVGQIFKLTQDENQFTITNGLGSAVFDFENSTVTYYNYNGYANVDVSNYMPYLDCMISGGKNFFVTNLSRTKFEGIENVRVINFADYNIPLYYVNGNGYMPIEIFETYLLPINGSIVNFIYNGSAIYNGSLSSVAQAKEILESGDIYKADYMEYTYNLLALNLDSFYGLDKKKSLVDSSKTITYLADGAYAALAPYHDKLVSTDPNTSDDGLYDVFANLIDDGGHSGYLGANVFADENIGTISHFGEQIQGGWDLGKKTKAARKAAGYDILDFVKENYGVELPSNYSSACSYEEIGDVAYFTFDSFAAASEKVAVDETNYWQNTIYGVNYANKQLHREGAPKNLVIDLSNNGGGAAVAECFIGSWLCNGVTTTVHDTKNKTYMVQTHYADVDFDGDYDANDYLPDDVNVYCIINRCSFSCGNLLPYHLKEQKDGVKFIGSNTGGGSCEVKSGISTGLGSTYQISCPYQLGSVTNSTSYSNFVSVEDGVAADWYAIPTDTDENIAKYYDRATINEKILAQA